MPETKTVKISKETYAKLSEIAGELQMRLQRPVSLEEAMKYLISLKGKGSKITDLAGSWEISDTELTQIKTSLTEVWKRWRIPEL
jgi:predicted CopG family antitoxin